MRAFWLPSKTPEARALLGRPDMDTYCPASGKKLRLKDLIPVRLTRVPEGQTGFAMDPVTQDTFTNASRLVLLKSTGARPRPPRQRHCLTRCWWCPVRKVKEKQGVVEQRVPLAEAPWPCLRVVASIDGPAGTAGSLLVFTDSLWRGWCQQHGSSAAASAWRG